MKYWVIYTKKNASEWRPVKVMDGPEHVDEWIIENVKKYGTSPYDYTAVLKSEKELKKAGLVK